MPKGKEYNMQTVGKAPQTTPKSVMGDQGHSVTIKPMFNKPKPTKQTRFPE